MLSKYTHTLKQLKLVSMLEGTEQLFFFFFLNVRQKGLVQSSLTSENNTRWF